jgi:type IV pilus assembly protein PilP
MVMTDNYIEQMHKMPGVKHAMCVCGLSLLIVVLAGCSGGEYDELYAYIKAVKARPAGRIAPVPEFKPYESFAYSDQNQRDPFSVFTKDEEVGKSDSGIKLRPDMNRNKEALEEYPLDTLHFVGHLERGDERWAIITSPDHLVYRVRIGNHLGTNYGEIVAISETQIDIKEIIEDGMGGWIEREAALSLTEK